MFNIDYEIDELERKVLVAHGTGSENADNGIESILENPPYPTHYDDKLFKKFSDDTVELPE